MRKRIAGWLLVMSWLGTFGIAKDIGDERPDHLGVFIEGVKDGSSLEKAGLRTGDAVYAWTRLANPPANPEPASGEILSPFDWREVEIEQAPRGLVRLTGQRDGKKKVFEVVPGEWKGTVRPYMPERVLKEYQRGKTLIQADNPQAGIHIWQKVAGNAENQSADRSLRCWLLLRIGDAWGGSRIWDKAYSTYSLALEAAPDRRSRIAVLEAIAQGYRNAGDPESARQAYTSAQEIRESMWGESLASAGGLSDLGALAREQGRLDVAQDYWQRALEIRHKMAPGSLDLATSLNNLGILAHDRGDLEKANEYGQDSLEIRQRLAPGGLDVAKSLNNLGLVAWNRGDLERAISYLDGALKIIQKLAPNSLNAAAILNNLGLLAHGRGYFDRATKYHEESLKIKENLAPGSLDIAASLGNLGILAQDRGDLDQAAGYYERSLDIAQRLAPGSLSVATSLNNLGTLARRRGDLDRAAEYYERSLVIKQELAPGSLDVASTLNNLGILASDRGDFERAAEMLERILEITQKLAPGSLDVATSLNNLGALALDRGDLGRAAEYFDRALRIRKNLKPGSLGVAEILHNLGNIASDEGDLNRAAEYYIAALDIQQHFAPGSSAEAETLHALATLRLNQNQLESALALFLRAIQALEDQVTRLGGSQDVRADFRAERVVYFRDTIALLLRLRQPERAFHILERSRARSFLAQLTQRDLEFSEVPEELEQERRNISHTYDQIQNEIARLVPGDQAAKRKTLFAQLRQLRHDYEDTTERIVKASPKLGSLRYPRPLDVKRVRQVLDPGTVMLSYSVGEDETHLFVVTRDDGLEVTTLPLGRETARREIERILELQMRRSSDLLYAQPLRQAGEYLYHRLIQPAEALITSSKRVLIVPDGPLHLLPFALLVRKTGSTESDGDRDFQYLVEWKPLHTVLSATVYAELQNHRRSQPRESTDVIALAAFGDPLYPSQYSVERSGDDLAAGRNIDVYFRSAVERGFDLRRLPYSREEVKRIAALYPEGVSRAFLGAEASEEQAKSVGKSARIIHLAAHGRFDDRIPLNSYLALTIPEEFRRGRENGLLQAWEIFEGMRLDADLVVLSACESGVGEEVDGEGLKGLTRAFQFAGARSVMPTLWQVDDQATAELTVRFYRHLREGLTKDEALRAAQMELIRGPIKIKDRLGQAEERDLSLPYYWAAFQLIGDWQ